MSAAGLGAAPPAPLLSAQAVDAARREGRAALVAYLPVGFPDLETSIAAARAAVEGGADILELGPPYSDPLMDGPVIARAVDSALRAGTRVSDTFRVIEGVADAGAAVLVMSYWNLVDRYGVAAFAKDLSAAGGCGIITPDLIPDEAAEWVTISDAHDLERVFLVAPSSPAPRLRLAVETGRGWIYAASTMGVTGLRARVGDHARDLVERTRAAGAERVCVGLGVSTAEQAAEVAGYADGVIVGTAFVRALADAAGPAEGVDAVRRLAEELAIGVRRRSTG